MPSVNDDFADAIAVVIETDGGTYTSEPIANTGNTTEPGEPDVGASDALSMWFGYTPATSGTATFDTSLSTAITSTDTFMAIHTGADFASMVTVASDDDGGGSATSRVADLPVTAGETYWIQVGGFGFSQFNCVLRVVGPATTAGGPPPSIGEAFWWDGTTKQPATLLGWWDGTTVQPATITEVV